MSTVLGAYMSSADITGRIMELSAQAELDKIYALESTIETVLNTDYMMAECTVLSEGGTLEDLETLYMEAEQNANEKKGNIIGRLISWISTNLSRFFGWISNLFGPKCENLTPNTKYTVNSFAYDTSSKIVKAWKKLKDVISGIFSKLENNVNPGVLEVGKIFTSVGLGFLGGKKYTDVKKKNDKGETKEVPAEEITNVIKEIDEVRKDSNKFLARAKKLKNHIDERFNTNRETMQANKNAKKAAKNNKANNTEANNQQPAENSSENVSTESVNGFITPAMLFGNYNDDVMTEASSKNGKSGSSNNNANDSSGNKAAPNNAPNNKQQGTNNTNNENPKNNGSSNVPANEPNKTDSNPSPTNGNANNNTNTTTASTNGKPANNQVNSGDKKTGNPPQNAETNKPANGVNNAKPEADEQPKNEKSSDNQTKPKYDVTVNITAGLRTALDLIIEAVKFIMESSKDAWSRISEAISKNKNTNNNQNGEEATTTNNNEEPANNNANADNQNEENTSGTNTNESVNLFGIDESEFAYLNEMSEDDYAEFAEIMKDL